MFTMYSSIFQPATSSVSLLSSMPTNITEPRSVPANKNTVEAVPLAVTPIATSLESHPLFAPFTLWLQTQPRAACLDEVVAFNEFTKWRQLKTLSKTKQSGSEHEVVCLLTLCSSF